MEFGYYIFSKNISPNLDLVENKINNNFEKIIKLNWMNIKFVKVKSLLNIIHDVSFSQVTPLLFVGYMVLLLWVITQNCERDEEWYT